MMVEGIVIFYTLYVLSFGAFLYKRGRQEGIRLHQILLFVILLSLYTAMDGWIFCKYDEEL